MKFNLVKISFTPVECKITTRGMKIYGVYLRWYPYLAVTKGYHLRIR